MKKLFIFLALFLFCNTGYAQQSQYFAIYDFSGGKNSFANPYLIPANQCLDVENMRFDTVFGGLSKRPSVLQDGTLGAYEAESLYRFYSVTNDTKYIIGSGSTTIKYKTTGAYIALHSGL